MIRYIFLLILVGFGTCYSQNPNLIAPVPIVTAGPQEDELGAGIIVGQDGQTLYVATAFHVVESFQELITVSIKGIGNGIKAHIELPIPEYDLVVLAIELPDQDIPPVSYLPASAPPEMLERVIVIGHPNGSLWDVNLVARMKTWDIDRDYAHAKFHLTQEGSGNGNSGGPVLNQENQLLGMVQKVNSAQTICLRSSMMLRILKSNDIPLNLLTGIDMEEKKSNYEDPFAGQMIWVEPGRFTMGTDIASEKMMDHDGPAHEVSVDGFWMGQHEITVGEYLVFCNEMRDHWPEWLEPGGRKHIATAEISLYKEFGFRETDNESLPVAGITYDDALAFCAWLSQKSGYEYSLPTEAQWEYAARGGHKATDTRYSGSNTPEYVGHFGKDNDTDGVQEVKTRSPNELGIFDMSGNVMEWCADWYGETYYQISPSSNPAGPEFGSWRIVRGGSYGAAPQAGTVTARFAMEPATPSFILGFRVTRNP